MAEQGKVICPVCGAQSKRPEFGDDFRGRRIEALKSPKQATAEQQIRALRASRIRRQNGRA